MNCSYTPRQLAQSEKDVIEIYRLAEEKMRMSCIPYSLVQLRNAFQVFRYAFREWALTREEGVVLRALMVRDSRVREVKSYGTEMVISVDDEESADAIAQLLKRDGYTEDKFKGVWNSDFFGKYKSVHGGGKNVEDISGEPEN